MRHAKTEMHSIDGTDFSRHLTTEGLAVSTSAGKYLLKKKIMPNRILSSSALRAAQTAQKVAWALGVEESMVELDDAIYNAAEKKVVSLISAVDDKIDTLLVVGHNPTFTKLVRKVSEVRIDNLTPGSFIALRYHIKNWSELGTQKGEFLFFAHPPFAG